MEGLAGYVALLWYRKVLGNNEQRLLLYLQGRTVCEKGQDIVLAKCGVFAVFHGHRQPFNV